MPFILIAQLPLLTYLPAAFLAILLLKAVFFLRYKTSSWRFNEFIYFNSDHIQNSRSPQTQSAKRMQNILSQIMISMGVLTVLTIMLRAFLEGA